MATLPHDLTDLRLAPTALAVEARLSELALLDVDELGHRVLLDTNHSDRTRELRASALLESVQYLIDLHGWILSWDPRGVRMKHGVHELVLGVPPTFQQYVDQVSAA